MFHLLNFYSGFEARLEKKCSEDIMLCVFSLHGFDIVLRVCCGSKSWNGLRRCSVGETTHVTEIRVVNRTPTVGLVLHDCERQDLAKPGQVSDDNIQTRSQDNARVEDSLYTLQLIMRPTLILVVLLPIYCSYVAGMTLEAQAKMMAAHCSYLYATIVS